METYLDLESAVSSAWVRRTTGFCEKEQPGPQYRCGILLKGAGTVSVCGGPEESLQAPCIYQIMPGSSFSLEASSQSGWEEYRICLPDATWSALTQLHLLRPGTTFPIRPQSYITDWISNLEYLKTLDSPYSGMEQYFDLQRLLITLHRQQSNPYWSHEFASVRTTINQILKEGFCRFSVRELADSCALSETKFRQVFLECTGRSPIQYIREVNMRYAKMLLTEGKTVQETAEILGYADAFSFSKQFKKETGITPSQFARQS